MKSFIRVILMSLLTVVVLTTCNSPMGMGNQVDFEPPILTIVPKPPTPIYVRDGTQLTGTVTDNDVVDRVILRDSKTGEELFKAKLLPEDGWEINLVFSDEQNGETILADIVAFDRAGNSGAESIASVMLTIDKRPPVVEDIWIQRSSVKTTDLDNYINLFALERSDPNGEINANINKYQNGAFNFKAKLAENETRIDSLKLIFYDYNSPDTELLSLQPEDNSSVFSPQWYVTEDMLLNAGNIEFPELNYKDEYKNNNKRYYYRLRISAIDKSKNESGITENDEGVKIIQDLGYFCMWQKADFPKGILDPLVVGAGTDINSIKGSSLPVEFFDDDKLEWAFAALFTKEQWDGSKKDKDGNIIRKYYIADGVSLSGSDEDKFSTLQTRLLSGQPVYNWRYDDSRSKSNPDSEPVINLLSSPVDEKIYYLITGNDPSDFGEFVVVTLVKDQKQPPHNATEYPNIVKYKKYNVNLVDENAPVIVYDKVGGSPEENTFPKIDGDGNFRIFGYTLREDKERMGLNQVEKFRIAWIPFDLATENVISRVRKALGPEPEEGDPKDSDFPAGVQWWDISSDVKASAGWQEPPIGNTEYRKQHFEKTFNVLGGNDDLKPEYKNFYYGGKFENTTKLFIFFAEDNMGHQVYSQFYLLGNRTPPTIKIFDITDKLTITAPPAPSVFDHSLTGDITDEYIADRDTFNKTKYPDLYSEAYLLGKSDESDEDESDESKIYKSETYRAYPRGTSIIFWVIAKTNGDLALTNIKMEDITKKIDDGDEYPKLGYYKDSDYALGYVEYFPEVSQRVFLFTATDSLGNEAKVQRTIAIANAATLRSVTTAEQNGTYPAGKTIELRANFDGMIKLESNDPATKPKLNVLYQKDSTYTVEPIACEDVDNVSGQLFLNFKFTVPENAEGRLETLYIGTPNNPGSIDRPITVNAANKILDFVRGDAAYTPGNVTGFLWKDAANSLQYHATLNKNGKNINLDGVIPTIKSIKMVNTKAASTNGTGNWYLKSGESISFELTASKNLKVTGTSSLKFRLQRPNNAGYTAYDQTNFDYRKVTGKTIVFTLDVNRTTIPQDGILVNTEENPITLFNPGNITDTVGNPIDVSSFNTALDAFNIINDIEKGKTIFFDLTPPTRPVTTLTTTEGKNVGDDPTTTLYYGTTPYMTITNISATAEPYGIEKRQYSLDGGLYWVEFPVPLDTVERPWTTTNSTYNALNIKNGQWSLKTRFIDRAGNEGATTEQLIYVNTAFPKLLGVNVIEPKTTYIGGGTLNFTLDFDDVVTVPATGVTMTLNDLTSETQTPGGSTPSYSFPVTATAGTGRTVTFTWKLTANTYDMLNGLKITSLSIGGLKDKFGNSGPTTGPLTDGSVTVGTSTVTYNFKDHKVSTIIPTIRSKEPQNAQGRTGNITVFSDDPETVTVVPTTKAKGSISTDNKTIRLNFSKPMQKGNGTITIRPHTTATLGYAIPAVFENDGYYVTYTYDTNDNVTAETKSSTAMADSTYVSGFYDIFNSVNATDKTTLIGSTSMSAPKLSNVTGLSVGPYLKTTHGLLQGAGYTGNYGNNTGTATITQPGINAPGTRGTNYMIPDVNTKWVLNYLYDDLFSVSTTAKTMPAAQGGTTLSSPSSIRAVLDRAKWRWQEIPVTNTNVTISDKTVTITLSEPLLPGLQWDVDFTEGTFTDEAGNKAAEMTRGTYWFWSKGVQKPVIRVDRKSYDARAGGANANYSGTMFGVNQTYNASGYNGTIVSFDTIAYRITSETPQARLFDVSQLGKDFTQGGVSIGSITAAWTGRVTNQNITNITNNQYITWNGPKEQRTNNNLNANDQLTVGTWVRPNLIFRNAENGTYKIMEEGLDISKDVRGLADTGGGFTANNNRYYGFRSYNKDATYGELNDLTVPNTSGATFSSSGAPRSLSFDALEASKNYVVAQARIDHTNTEGSYTIAAAVSSLKGFEGVFRTVMAMNQTGLTIAGSTGSNTNITTNSHPVMVDGTNVRSGTPTISGFPVRDNGCASDSRYTKVFYKEGTDNDKGTNGKQFYWVSSEIISPWYVQPYGRGDGGGSHGKTGDVEDWITAGYGDLTFVLNLAVH